MVNPMNMSREFELETSMLRCMTKGKPELSAAPSCIAGN